MADPETMELEAIESIPTFAVAEDLSDDLIEEEEELTATQTRPHVVLPRSHAAPSGS